MRCMDWSSIDRRRGNRDMDAHPILSLRQGRLIATSPSLPKLAFDSTCDRSVETLRPSRNSLNKPKQKIEELQIVEKEGRCKCECVHVYSTLTFPNAAPS